MATKMTTIGEALALALQHHEAGNLRQAEQLYRQILHLDPHQADVHHLLGVIASQQGFFDKAVASIRQAIALKPGDAVYQCNLGAALEALGLTAEAIANYQVALRLQPAYPEAQNNLGNALSSSGNVEEAIAHYQFALRLRPEFAEAHNGVGNALMSLDMPAEAETHYRDALRVRPEYAEAHNGLGNSLVSQGKLQEAITHYLHALGIRPGFAEAHHNLGNAQLGLEKLDEAVASYEEALRIRPSFMEAINSLGIALQRQEKLEEAIGCFQKALGLKLYYTEALTNLGNAFRDQSRFTEALATYEHALKSDPARAETQHNLGQLRLLMGDFAEGWPAYEWRLRTRDFLHHARLNAFTQPRWDGSPLNGRTLLVVAEQGLGDTLQFIRYVPFIQERGGRVIVQCQASLLRLLTACWGKAPLVAKGAPLPEFDVHASLLSLPGIVGTSLDSIPAAIPYLHADATLVRHWREELKPLAGFKIGIAWQGSPTYRQDRLRSIAVEHFLCLATVPGIQLISLQKGPGTDQLDRLPSNHGIVNLGDRLDDISGPFMDTAAIMANVDLVICSDSAVAHLAGALGVKVWVALPKVPDWRWLLARRDNPWYPTMLLFRQAYPGNWDSVFDRLAEAIKQSTDDSDKHG